MSSRGRRTRLLCIPGAGAAAGRFERLRPGVADLVELRTFELPGRGIRFAEPSPTRLTDHLDHFIERVEAEPNHRWIVLGESLGAVTAVWLAGTLADSTRAEVIGVVTVASAPGVTGRRPAAEVVEQLRVDAAQASQSACPPPGPGRRPGPGPADEAITGVEAVVADIEAAQALGRQFRLSPVTVPVATIRGRDDGLISDEAARRWQTLTEERWSYCEVPGTHYQFDPPSPALVESIRSAIDFIGPTTSTASP